MALPSWNLGDFCSSNLLGLHMHLLGSHLFPNSVVPLMHLVEFVAGSRSEENGCLDYHMSAHETGDPSGGSYFEQQYEDAAQM